MLTLGPISFTAPWVLLGLASLPAIWWLLRATPPAPKRIVFPPLALLMGLAPDENTPTHTPWWIVALRLVLVSLVVIALAKPTIFSAAEDEAAGPLILVIDDGWEAAASWADTRRDAMASLETAARAGRTAAIVYTAPERGAETQIIFDDPAALIPRLAARTPKPWSPDPIAAAQRLVANTGAGAFGDGVSFAWFTDRIDRPGVEVLAQTLADLGPVRIQGPSLGELPILVRPPEAHPRGFSVTLVRADAGAERSGAVLALDGDGRALSRTPFTFEPGANTTNVVAEAPLEVRNRAALIRVETRPTAGGAQVLDDAWRQPLVGLVSVSADDDRQPLLSEIYYIEQALVDRAVVVRGALEDLLARDPSVIIVTDTGQPTPGGLDRLETFVREGGLLIRFAGPRLAEDPDMLIPVVLRGGGRAMGGAMAWDEPQAIAPFPEDGPFFDLVPPDDTTVSRQVLAQPRPDLSPKVWARLASDATPLVTSDRLGEGRVILFHITANTDWSNLPLSGLFAQMLTRTLAFAQISGRSVGAGQDAGGPGGAGDVSADLGASGAGGAWTLKAALSGAGTLSPTEGGVSLSGEAVSSPALTPDAPPGIYARGAARTARNVADGETVVTALAQMPNGLAIDDQLDPGPRRLAGLFLIGAMVAFVLDIMAMAAMGGKLSLPWWGMGLRTVGRGRGAQPLGFLALVGTGLVMMGSFALSPDALAQNTQGGGASSLDGQERAAIEALDSLRLAYVVTGDTRVDRMSYAGLYGLSRQLVARTSTETGDPLGLDLDADELGFYPLIYWPISEDMPAPSADVAAKLDGFMKSGGVLILDTQDGGTSFSDQPHQGLAILGTVLDIPPLMRLPKDPQGHVLNRSFYLLNDLPGRWADGTVWLEADQRGSARDGVSGVIIGSADWAAAWAVDDTGAPLGVIAGGSQRQREMAQRAGVNLVMYVLTGNYKADQVHVQDILERLAE